jgi:hypothetical protein
VSGSSDSCLKNDLTFVQGAGREELAGKSPGDGGAATGAADWSVFQTKSKSVDEQVNNYNLFCGKRQTWKIKN